MAAIGHYEGPGPVIAAHSKEAEGAIAAMVTLCERKFDQSLQNAKEVGDEEFIVMLQKLRARFLDWRAYLGVFAHAKGSLDYRVERFPQYRDMILLVLDMLNVNLLQGSGISSGSSSDDSSDHEIDQKNVELDGIRNAINELDRLAIHLRQAATSSIDARVQAFAPKRAQEVSSFEAKAIFAVHASYPRTQEYLHRILSKSMTQRYTKLLYLTTHDKKLRADRRRVKSRSDSSDVQKEPLSLGAQPLGANENQTSKTLAQNHFPQSTSRMSATIPSEPNIHPKAKMIEDKGPDRSRDRAFTVRQTNAKFPSPPQFDDEDGLQKPCPFCWKRLEKEQFSNTVYWR
ncbi:hypothetical protein E8E14_007510 [Neopestalotiopsis sp. 37M]|nr:hypothetical protein E8E14_007510 [Neopestalotiopsis sp. 37M]